MGHIIYILFVCAEDEASVLRARLKEISSLLTESQLTTFLTKHNVSFTSISQLLAILMIIQICKKVFKKHEQNGKG